MTETQIMAMQEKIGTEADGFWGTKSVAACQRHLRALMPKPHPFPKPTSAALNAFYGDPAKGEVAKQRLLIEVKNLGVQYEGHRVDIMLAHKACGLSLLRVLKAIAASPHAHLLSQYAGLYNHRPMRGGTRWSLHAYAAAIDLAPATNGLHTHWPTRATMPLEVMEMFAREGWLPAGAFWGRDAMHFQATQ